MKLEKIDLEHKFCNWWLRSAYSSDRELVGRVSFYGDVGNGLAYNYTGVLPACIII